MARQPAERHRSRASVAGDGRDFAGLLTEALSDEVATSIRKEAPYEPIAADISP